MFAISSYILFRAESNWARRRWVGRHIVRLHNLVWMICAVEVESIVRFLFIFNLLFLI
jgi:hypothetical protein